MIVLGIDTSGYANTVGVVDGTEVLTDFTYEARTDSLEKIVANIDATLQSAGLTLDDMQGIGVGLGPGSWTGIRVCVTVAKILAFSTGKPVCGIPTLEALAYNVRNESSLICPIISAGTRDMVYAAWYRAEDGNITRKGEYYAGDVRGLSVMVKEPTIFIGYEVTKYSRLVSQTPGLASASIRAIEAVPNGATMALLAASRLEQGVSDDVLALTPLYLKESTARAFLSRYAGNAQVKG